MGRFVSEPGLGKVRNGIRHKRFAVPENGDGLLDSLVQRSVRLAEAIPRSQGCERPTHRVLGFRSSVPIELARTPAYNSGDVSGFFVIH